jgi:glycine/D-amino acid oxidase-like deaminating enzyme
MLASSLPVHPLWWDEPTSKWLAETAGSTSLHGPALRSALPGDCDVDVCIVGGGFTGLWTAWYLVERDPTLRVLVVEAERVSFGASGRNGGWVQSALPTALVDLAKQHGEAQAIAMHRAMVDTVDRIGKFAYEYAPKACFAHDGNLQVARSLVQLNRLQTFVNDQHSVGLTTNDARMLSKSETDELLRVDRGVGGAFTPHCASVQPAELVRALAYACEQRNVKIVEKTTVKEIHPQRVVTNCGTVRAAVSVRATEGFSALLPNMKRSIVPLYSLMIATEPLTDSQWQELGWKSRFTFNDGRNSIIYAQRTADGRIAFGGRGAPYHFGSAIHPSFDDAPRVHNMLQSTLGELFPSLRDVAITHRWGGPLGVPRDWYASVGFDRGTGIAYAGGYVGDGVGATHLAGQSLADLITGTDTERVHLPWINHVSRKWEPEPLRTAGINVGLRLAAHLDEAEARGKSTKVRRRLFNMLV